MSAIVLERLRSHFGEAILETHAYRGDETAVVPRERIIEVLKFLRDDPELLFNYPTDLTAVDYLDLGREPRFEVVYQLYSIKKKHRVRVKVRLDEEDPKVDSATPLFSGWNWFEREAYDMFGIVFVGHPDLRRLFMYDEFVGHPLRKDYPKDKRQPLVRREGMT
jgi:NADH-quinone oxidoreductase subunit C